MINTLLKRRMENTKKNKKGFTLVELIVVLVIIAILAAVLVPTMSGYIGRARKTAAQSACKTQVTAYSAAITDYIGVKGSVNASIATENKTAQAKAATDSDSIADGKDLEWIVTKAVNYGGTAIVGKKDSGKQDAGVNSITISSDGALTGLVYTEGNYTVTYTEANGYSVAKNS